MKLNNAGVHRRTFSVAPFVVWIALFGIGSTGMAAADELAEPIATMSDQGGPSWTPQVDYERLTLRVSGPGGLMIEESFSAGQSPSLSRGLPDGSYTYELRVVPVVDRDVRELLKLARETGDDSIVAGLRAAGRLPGAPLVQSGHFRISGGDLVSSNAVE